MNDRLVSEYIGKNAQEIIDGNVNWAAAVSGQLIGPVWFFYGSSGGGSGGGGGGSW